MPGIGVITNPRSRKNQKDPRLTDRLRAIVGSHGRVVATESPAHVREVAREFLRDGIEILALNGGDGTNSVVLTAFIEEFGDRPLPTVALLRGGTMNTISNSVGVRGNPRSILRRLVDGVSGRTELETVEYNLLRIDAGNAVHFGFIFGTGLFFDFLEEYYSHGDVSPAIAAGVLSTGVWSILTGGEMAQRLSRGVTAAVDCGGIPWVDGTFKAVVASTQSQIGLGFVPFPRCRDKPDHFHALVMDGSMLQVARSLPGVRLGRLDPAVYRDRVCRDILLRGPASIGFLVDGDLHRSAGPISVHADRRIRIAL